jgi:hypothetical protein
VPCQLIEKFLAFYHNGPIVHVARDRLYAMLRKRFCWPSMYADVSNWVADCTTCRNFKPNQPLQHGLLTPIIATFSFEMGGIDIVGPLKCTERGYKYILVFIDLFISWVEAAPMRSLTAKEVPDLLFKMIVSRHGCPHKILTDQGTQFKSEECYVIFEGFTGHRD